jgi:branched-subunit amino acid aminotransferase/4-amino-4-deoxychorismate lyase
MLCCAVPCCADYVPPLGKGALYLRPLLMGSGPILGLGPAPSYTFAIYAAAVGSYFKVNQAVELPLQRVTKKQQNKFEKFEVQAEP